MPELAWKPGDADRLRSVTARFMAAHGATSDDSAPDWTDPGRLRSLVERPRLTFLGVSPTLVRRRGPLGPRRRRTPRPAMTVAAAMIGRP